MPRIAIFLNSENDKLPGENTMMSVSFVKDLIRSTNEERYHELYEYGDKHNKKIKDINTAIYVPNMKNIGNELAVDGDIVFNIGMYDLEMLCTLYNGAIKKKEFQYQNYKFRVKRVVINMEKEIEEDGVIFKTMSPLIIKNKEGKYLSIEDEEYESCLNYISNLILENIRGEGLKRPLKFIPLNLKKRVLKEKLRNFNERDYYYINAYTGTFFLKGEKEDLNALHKTGLGYRRSQFAGMVEVLK